MNRILFYMICTTPWPNLPTVEQYYYLFCVLCYKYHVVIMVLISDPFYREFVRFHVTLSLLAIICCIFLFGYVFGIPAISFD